MARHHTLGTIKGVANRITRTAATLSGKAVDKAVGEVSTRIAARRANTPGSPPTAPAERTATTPDEPAARQSATSRPDPAGTPSPADVARVVARHPENRPHPATPAKRKPARTSAPGAKLPARAGQGILGV